jgi:flagellin-specific chaperone FliS
MNRQVETNLTRMIATIEELEASLDTERGQR